jgi:aspartate/methionine/tyrosine aminotransferase
MNFPRQISETAFPPIAEAMSWIPQAQSNREFLNLCQAVPSYPPAPALQQEIARLALQPNTGGYTDIYGIGELRAAFGAHMGGEYGAALAASQVAITTGCNQAFAAAVMAIAERGDNVIMPCPWYFNHHMWLNMLGIEVRAIAAFEAGQNHPSIAAARLQINERSRAIILCTPNNPTGAIYPPQVLQAFYDLAKAHGLRLIMDETYKDFRPDAAAPHQLFNDPDWGDTLIQLYSFSKIYALAGYRLGAMISGEALLREAGKILDCMTICPPHITQRAVLFGLSELGAWKAGKIAVMRERLEVLRSCFNTSALQYELVSSGAYFAYVRHPFGGQTSKSVAQRLAAEHDVLCLPGSMFGQGQEDYLRFAFANVEASRMAPLVDRLVESQG